MRNWFLGFGVFCLLIGVLNLYLVFIDPTSDPALTGLHLGFGVFDLIGGLFLIVLAIEDDYL